MKKIGFFVIILSKDKKEGKTIDKKTFQYYIVVVAKANEISFIHNLLT